MLSIHPRKLILVIFIWFSGQSVFAYTKNNAILFSKIERMIEFGQLKKAEQELKYSERHRHFNTLEKYNCKKLLCKIYLVKQSFSEYNQQLDHLVRLSKQLNPIYQSEAFAHKAYYWHYMMWADSALYYSNKSYDFFRKNERYKEQIEIPFIYEIHAISYSYRIDSIKPQSYLDLPIQDFKKKQFQWFDSAIYYEKKYPFKFSTDKSMLFRSYANRWLDEVVGRRPKTPTKMQLFAFKKANILYDKGLRCLKPWHKNDFTILHALKGAIHTYIHKYNEADLIFSKALHAITPELHNRQKLDYSPLLSLLTFRVRNTILMPYDKVKINQQIHLFLSLKKDFWLNFKNSEDLKYDPYSTSPYINLYSLYTLKSKNEPNNRQTFSTAVSYLLTLKVHFYFLKTSNSFKKSLPYFNVSIIQKRLKPNECFLFMHSDNTLFEGKKILITKNKLLLVNSARTCQLNYINLDTTNFKEFKQISYDAYNKNIKQVLKLAPNATKIFISYDDIIPYEILVKDTLAHSYSDAKYLGNQINFVRLYNPYVYFSTPNARGQNKIEVRSLKQKNTAKLYFMDDFMKKSNYLFSVKNYEGNLNSLLKERGILHLYGHGEFSLDDSTKTYTFQLRYQTKFGEKFEKKITDNFEIKRDLVVLNNCFSGFPNFNVNEYNRIIPFKILSNGAKAVISSSNKVDDYYSSVFFEIFYEKITNGLNYEDAFFESKKQFFNDHKELRNPQIWNGLQLIVNQNVVITKPEPLLNYMYLFAVVITLDMMLSLLHVFRHNPKQDLRNS